MRIAVILSGGKASRMGGADKGALELNGKRLIDIVIDRLAPQADQVLISGPRNYETGLVNVPDRRDGPAGPAGGLWSALAWIQYNYPAETVGFFTAPVDGPFLLSDLCERLHASEKSSVAKDEAGLHPTFAWWRIEDLDTAFNEIVVNEGVSLKSLAKAAAAKEVSFPGDHYFRNINTPEDLAAAEAEGARL
ncbi:molybdenum cofactor guanylyltransferase [Hyphococcus flavus]|uniref:Molybdenum cofactor guanylyltransferase n=1 Tax=Hyphococcus flavus TaxID=1866326 RepID=A0AAE9ZEJ7_9PROT|nr:molybdenum cofactor guanylyltransferase [Hyphococcus flavus]WDI31338.1 molybdenum cofactor guanylyltransferase [Hyphococcus flavus]